MHRNLVEVYVSKRKERVVIRFLNVKVCQLLISIVIWPKTTGPSRRSVAKSFDFNAKTCQLLRSIATWWKLGKHDEFV
ncbi:hypothetical protein AVEN_226133-1, partial [Araneus ventricosus]